MAKNKIIPWVADVIALIVHVDMRLGNIMNYNCVYINYNV